MVDFERLGRELAARKVKVHALYHCPKCGCYQRFVQVMPSDWRCYTGACSGPDHRRGRLNLVAKIFVPKGHPSY